MNWKLWIFAFSYVYTNIVIVGLCIPQEKFAWRIVASFFAGSSALFIVAFLKEVSKKNKTTSLGIHEQGDVDPDEGEEDEWDKEELE